MSNLSCSRLMRMAALTVILGLLQLGRAGAEERVYQSENFAITPPDGWADVTTAQAKPGVVAAFRSPKDGRMLIVMVDGKNAPSVLDEKFIAEFESATAAGGGGKKLSSRLLDVQGLQCYERVGWFARDDNRISLITWLIPTALNLYSVQAVAPTGKAGEDTEIRWALESFRFLQPPEPPLVKSGNNEEEEARKRAGAFAFAGFVVLMLAGIAVCVYFLMRGKKERQPKKRSGERHKRSKRTDGSDRAT